MTSETRPPAPRRSRRPRLPAVLRDEPQYRLLFAGQVLSILGDRVTMVVLPFAVLAVGGGVADVALVSVAQFIPFAVLALPAGVWADRYDRKRILITSDVARFACQLIAGVLLVTDEAHVAHLVVLAAVYGAADAFFAPAFTGLLPGTVAPVNLQPANALRGLSYSTGSIVGPVLGGLLVAFAGGPGGAMLFDAATFAVSVACLVPLRPRVVAETLAGEDPEATTTHFLTSLREGWREVRSRPWVLAFLGGSISYHVVVLPGDLRARPGARRRGAGRRAVVGDHHRRLRGRLRRRRPAAAALAAAVRPARPSLMLLGASCQAAFIGSGLGTWGIAGLEVLAGVCVTGYFTLWETSLQEHVPQHALSRVASYDYLTSAGMIPVGNIVLGTVSAAAGLHETLVVMTVLGVTAAAVVAALPSVATCLAGRRTRAPARLAGEREGLATPGVGPGHGD